MKPQPIIVRGGTAKQRTALRHASHWMRGYLLGNRLAKNVTLNISLSKTLFQDGTVGECDFIDSNIHPRHFTIKIAVKQSVKQLLLTLAHEMVHVKQFAKDEMFDYAQEHLTRWKKRIINLKKTPHAELPWEQEAWNLQGHVFSAYCLSQKNTE